MSFFDESDEPLTEVRSPSGSGGRRRGSRTGGSGSGGGGRRPPARTPNGSILARRAVLVVGVIIVVILIAVGVDSCEGSARRGALRDYANGVNAVVTRSDGTGKQLFKALSGGAGNGQQVSQSVNQTEANAAGALKQAQNLSAPGSARSTQSHLVLALQMRYDGIASIASQVQAAYGNAIRSSAVTGIAAQMARFYASDVVYKDYAVPELVGALHHDGIAVGGSDGATINAGQFLPSTQWLTASYVASQLGVALSSSSSGNASSTPQNGTGGLRGHSLTSVSVAGTALVAGATNTISSSPTPTFTLDFLNGGDFDEYDVTCEVKVNGTSDTGTKVVSETFKGKPATCNVTLPHAPPKGDDTVVATIEKVPGETNLANNTLSFPVTFN